MQSKLLQILLQTTMFVWLGVHHYFLLFKIICSFWKPLKPIKSNPYKQTTQCVQKCSGNNPPLCSGVYQVAWSLRNNLDSGKINTIFLHRWCRCKRGWRWQCRDGLVLSLMKPLNCAGQWKKQQIYFIKFMMMMMIRIIVMIHVAFTLYYNYNYIVDDDDDVY